MKPVKRSFAWVISEDKYLDLDKVRKLRSVLKAIKNKAVRENKFFPVRDWLMVELGLLAGLRVEEMVNLKTFDLYFKKEQSSLVVQKGKGNKSRVVYFSEDFAKEVIWYLCWKDKSPAKSDYLFTNSNGRQLTKRALQKAFKRCLKLADIGSNYSIHCLRHTYATHLLKSSQSNLTIVQNQLGHASLRTTQLYINVLGRDLKDAVENIYSNKTRRG